MIILLLREGDKGEIERKERGREERKERGRREGGEKEGEWRRGERGEGREWGGGRESEEWVTYNLIVKLTYTINFIFMISHF